MQAIPFANRGADKRKLSEDGIGQVRGKDSQRNGPFTVR